MIMEKSELTNCIVNLKKGDMDYFPRFFESTKRNVFLSAYVILHSKEEAEDIVNETYIKFLETLDDVNPNKSIMAYLSTISRNLSLNLIKKREREVELEDEDTRLSSNDDYDLGLGVFDKARKILPSDEFEIILLAMVDDLKQREIAKIMKKPLGTISFKYAKAIKTLRRELQDERF